MKTTLPTESQEHAEIIGQICDIIVESDKNAVAAIILFGSFARGSWVYDRRTMPNGIIEEYASDYDLLILTRTNKQGTGHHRLNMKIKLGKKLKKYKRPHKLHTPSVIIESFDNMNQYLHEGQYFFTDIKKEGILLFDNGEFELGEAGDLSNEERRKIAQEYYDHWFSKGNDFLRNAKNSFEIKSLSDSAFQLHQATESFFNCTLLVTTGYKSRTHDIEELLGLCCSQSNKFLKTFPIKNEEQAKRFQLLRAAYIDARYKLNYAITEEQLEYLIDEVEKLKGITDELCGEYIESLR